MPIDARPARKREQERRDEQVAGPVAEPPGPPEQAIPGQAGRRPHQTDLFGQKCRAKSDLAASTYPTATARYWSASRRAGRPCVQSVSPTEEKRLGRSHPTDSAPPAQRRLSRADESRAGWGDRMGRMKRAEGAAEPTRVRITCLLLNPAPPLRSF